MIKRRLEINESQLKKQKKDGKSFGNSMRPDSGTLGTGGIEMSIRGEDSCIPPQITTISGNTFAALGNISNNTEKTLKQKRYELKKTQRLNKQLIAVMICYLLSFLVAFILNFRYIIPDFNPRFYYFRQILRILNVFFQSLIPVVSLYFNPHLTRILRRFRIGGGGRRKKNQASENLNNTKSMTAPVLVSNNTLAPPRVQRGSRVPSI